MARTLSVDIHRMTLMKLPKFEMFEEASQIRRAIKSVRSNIVEGYGRRRYKQEFVKFWFMLTLLATSPLTTCLHFMKAGRSLTKRFTTIWPRVSTSLAGRRTIFFKPSKLAIAASNETSFLSRIPHHASRIIL